MTIKTMIKKSRLKALFSVVKDNFLLFIFIICIGFVGLVAFYKIFISKPTYIYVKVKVGQGLWWATTQRPSLWYVKAIQQAKEQVDLEEKPVAKVLSVSYNSYWGNNQYDIYTTVRLKVSKVEKTGAYNFDRDAIGVGSPIDLVFPNVQFSGTIIALSEKPIEDIYEYKTIYVYKKLVNPWEFEQIHVGDSLMNGKETIFEVLDKERGETNDILLNDFGKMINPDIESYRYAKVKIKVRVKKIDGEYIYGEEYTVAPGRGIPVVINGFSFNDFVITKVE